MNETNYKIKARRIHRLTNLELTFLFIAVFGVGLHTGLVLTETAKEYINAYKQSHQKEIISPVIESCLSNCEEPVEQDKPIDSDVVSSTVGIASYYSEDGCVGCRDDLLMANGYRFRDSGITVAFNRASLGTFVRVTNIANNKEIVAEVTDTGGFEELGRIIDLNPAVKDLIDCTDLCEVKVEVL